MSLKITLLKVAVFAPFVAVLLLWAGLRPFVAAPIHIAETHHVTTLPSQFSTLSPELNAAIVAKIKGQERTRADYLPDSADSRRRLDEITRKHSLSPDDQKLSDLVTCVTLSRVLFLPSQKSDTRPVSRGRLRGTKRLHSPKRTGPNPNREAA
jgi:hypothetical protein